MRGDRHGILSLLRACNYDPDECISIFMHLEKDGRYTIESVFIVYKVKQRKK